MGGGGLAMGRPLTQMTKIFRPIGPLSVAERWAMFLSALEWARVSGMIRVRQAFYSGVRVSPRTAGLILTMN